MPMLSYEDWVDFTFGLSTGEPGMNTFYPGSLAGAAENCRRFFENSRETLRRVPRDAAAKALEVIPSIDGYGGLLSHPKLDPGDRVRLADSQFDLFRDTFADDPYGYVAFLWWEWLIGAEWDDGPAIREDRAMCDHMIDVLAKILEIESEECVRSALHGLNEFGPNSSEPRRTTGIVERLLASDRRLSADLRGYAMEVLSGNAR